MDASYVLYALYSEHSIESIAFEDMFGRKTRKMGLGNGGGVELVKSTGETNKL